MTYPNPTQPGYGYQPPVGPPQTPRKRHILRYALIGSGIAAVFIVAIAVTLSASKTPAPSSSTPPAATAPSSPSSTTSSAAVAAAPATEHASGTANQVITVSGLVPGTTYVLSYTATGSDVNALIVMEGQSNSLVDDINDSGSLSGSTLYTADSASITLQIQNADGENWTLTFTPHS